MKNVLVGVLITVAGSANAALIPGGTNELFVTQTITSLSGGRWQYRFDVTSADPSNVWQFIVYTSFDTGLTTAITFPNSAVRGTPLGDVPPGYDARNIDPSLNFATNMWYTPFGGPNGLPPGGTAALIFVGLVFDPGPKLFAYETVASGFVGGGTGPLGSLGEVEAVGHTTGIPEPAALGLIEAGLIALAVLKRFACIKPLCEA
jgi:hypothetical protein